MFTSDDIKRNPTRYRFRYTAKFYGQVVWESESCLATDVDGRCSLDKVQRAKQLELSGRHSFTEWRDHGSMVGAVYEVQ